MKTKYIDEIDRLESTHWWHGAKKKLLVHLTNTYMIKSSKPHILEVGAGSGNLLSVFAKKAHTTALDVNKTALKYCKKRGIEYLICANIETYRGFKKNYYDVIIAADILEHIKNDKAVVLKLHKMLRKNGTLIVHVPAHKNLFSYWDTMMGHQRRYSLEELRALLEQAGFNIEICSYRLFFLFPFVYAFRKLDSLANRGKRKQSDFKQFSLFNSIFLYIAIFEDFFVKTSLIKFPFGLSLIAVATK